MVLIFGKKKILGGGHLNTLESPLVEDSLNEGVVGDDGFLKIWEVQNDGVFGIMKKVRIRMVLFFGIDGQKVVEL